MHMRFVMPLLVVDKLPNDATEYGVNIDGVPPPTPMLPLKVASPLLSKLCLTFPSPSERTMLLDDTLMSYSGNPPTTAALFPVKLPMITFLEPVVIALPEL